MESRINGKYEYIELTWYELFKIIDAWELSNKLPKRIQGSSQEYMDIEIEIHIHDKGMDIAFKEEMQNEKD